MTLGNACRADLIIEGRIIVEVKSVEEVPKVAFRQLLTYLKLAGLHIGLLVNFNVPMIKTGIHRLVWQLEEPAEPSQL